MENKLLGKTDIEINSTYRNLKIVLILYTIVMLFIIVSAVYVIISKGKYAIATIIIGGNVIPYQTLESNYRKYKKEKKRRNL